MPRMRHGARFDVRTGEAVGEAKLEVKRQAGGEGADILVGERMSGDGRWSLFYAEIKIGLSSILSRGAQAYRPNHK